MKTIFVIQGFESMDTTGHMTDVVTLEIFAKNKEEALTKAKKYIQKKEYRISSIIEK